MAHIGQSWECGSFAELQNITGWGRGSVAWNINPQILGTPGSRYVVIGWKRLTDSNANNSNHQLGVDWVEMRCPTGT